MERARSAPRGARRTGKREVRDGHWLSAALTCLFAQQTAYAGLPDPSTSQEKFYWCTVTAIREVREQQLADLYVSLSRPFNKATSRLGIPRRHP